MYTFKLTSRSKLADTDKKILGSGHKSNGKYRWSIGYVEFANGLRCRLYKTGFLLKWIFLQITRRLVEE